MSWEVTKLCAERTFGSPVRKQIIMFLADKASDDGSGIWCSKGAIRRHTELGESTVKRAIGELVQTGILIDTEKRRRCKHGATVVYQINLTTVKTLDPIAESNKKAMLSTGSAEDQVHKEPPSGSTLDGVRGPERTPNHPKTIHKPSTGAGGSKNDQFDELWNQWPAESRPSKRSAAKHSFDRLSPPDQNLAVKFAHDFRRICLARKVTALMIPYLKERLFAELADGPQINLDSKLVITPERPEWSSWIEYFQANYGDAASHHFEQVGQIVSAERWPPKIAEGGS